jgi:hypothetical protein
MHGSVFLFTFRFPILPFFTWNFVSVFALLSLCTWFSLVVG